MQQNWKSHTMWTGDNLTSCAVLENLDSVALLPTACRTSRFVSMNIGLPRVSQQGAVLYGQDSAILVLNPYSLVRS